eukprot:4177955-Prymnesium_polylepis.1
MSSRSMPSCTTIPPPPPPPPPPSPIPAAVDVSPPLTAATVRSESPPPPAPPPSPPAQAPTGLSYDYRVVTSMVLEGSVQDYDSAFRSALRSKVATTTGVSDSSVIVALASASVSLTIIVSTASPAASASSKAALQR